MTKQMSAPHGGALVHRTLTPPARENILAQADEFPTIAVHQMYSLPSRGSWVMMTISTSFIMTG
jgi:hypothetical protein